MDPATEQQLTTLQRLLNERRSVLLAELQAAEQARAEPLAGAPHDVFDRKDEAAGLVAGRMLDAQEERDRHELGQVDAALHRLAAGNYGDCTDCGEPIALQRLLVQPAAQRCSLCESAWERASTRRQVHGATRRA